MREYIKKIVLAIRFMSKIVEKNDRAFSIVLNKESIELFKLSEALDLQEIKNKISYIAELVDLANIETLVTPMNASIFINSCNSFLRQLESEIKEREVAKEFQDLTLKNLEIYTEIFDRKKAKEEVQSKFLEKTLPHSPSPKDGEVVQIVVSEDVDTKREREEKGLGNKNINRVEQINFRHKRILEILSVGGLGLKELLEAMPEANEKTIQRDILLLIRGRKLIMIGKKRWAKYYLK